MNWIVHHLAASERPAHYKSSMRCLVVVRQLQLHSLSANEITERRRETENEINTYISRENVGTPSMKKLAIRLT